MSDRPRKTLLQRARKNLKHLVPKPLRQHTPATFTPDELEDLREFTGLSEASVLRFLRRERGKRISDEFDLLAPADAAEYAWFYRGNRTYLFEAHDAWESAIKQARPGMRCLDFGGGGGRNSLGMAAQGAEVFYVDLGIANSAFTRFRAAKRGLAVTVLDPLVEVDGAWRVDSVEAASRIGGFDLIVCDNVLEHVADYHEVLARLAATLAPRGRILECTPFAREKAYLWKPKEKEWDVHLKPKLPMREAMTRCGMRKVRGVVGLWERDGDGASAVEAASTA